MTSESKTLELLVHTKSWNAHYHAAGLSLCGQAPRQKPENYERMYVQVSGDAEGFVVKTNQRVYICLPCRDIVERRDAEQSTQPVSLPIAVEETQALWQCSTCGAMFPHTRGDADIAQCSKCVEVKVLVARVRVLTAERDEFKAQALKTAYDWGVLLAERDRLRAVAAEYHAVATFSAWDSGECRKCMYDLENHQHQPVCEYWQAEQALLSMLREGGD